VRLGQVYPGIDATFYGRDGQLEYDLDLAPGAKASALVFDLDGADRATIEKNGDLTIDVDGQRIVLHKPLAWQPDGQNRKPVEVTYALLRSARHNGRRIGLRLKDYDASKPLTIDPVLDFATYLSSAYSNVLGVAADATGNSYVLLETPGDAGFTVAKFDPNGNLLLTATIASTSSSSQYYNSIVPTGIAVNSSGAVYVVGSAQPGLPTTSNAFQPTNNNDSSGNTSPYYIYNAFLAVFQPGPSALSLSYCSYLGGVASGNGISDRGYGIAVDSSGNAYISGVAGSGNFPTTTGVYQPSYLANNTSAGFAAEFNPSLSGNSSLVYSTLLGGASTYETSIAVDGSGNAYVAGSAASGFPITSGAFSYAGIDAGASGVFVTKLNPGATALVYSAYLGPASGFGYLAVDGSGDSYATGVAAAEDFPTTTGAYQTSYPGAFVSELNPAGSSLIYSTFLGGPSSATNYNLAVPNNLVIPAGCVSACNVFVAGYTTASDLPAINAVQSYQGGSTTAFAVELNGTGSGALVSTYLGGLTAYESQPSIGYYGTVPSPKPALDGAGNLYIAGNLNQNTDYPVTPSPAEPATIGSGYLAKLGPANSANILATPSSYTFPTTIPVGVSSAIYSATPTTLALRNMGTLAVTLQPFVLTPSDEFAETDNCNGTLAGGAMCTMNLTFTPTAAGVQTGTIAVMSGATTVATIPLTGTGQNIGYLVASPSSLSFADQVVGTTSATQTVTVTNPGNEPATFYGSQISFLNTGFVEQNNCPSQLQPTQSCQIAIQFAPSQPGFFNPTLYVYNSGIALALAGQGVLSGTGGSGTSAVWPGAVNLGNVLVNTSTSAQVYFTNTSPTASETINSASIALTGNLGQAGDFSISGCAVPYQVAAAGSCTITVNFTPSAVGTETAVITVTDSSASSPHTVTVSGIGLAATQVLEFAPGNQVFPDQPLGYQSAAQTFSVYNTGTAPVTIDRSLVTGDFQITYDRCSGTTLAPPITPGVIASYGCQVSVAFTPTALGARNGQLTLVDAATGDPQMLNLTGNGIAVTGSITVSPSTAIFPAQPLGLTSATQTITLTNPGNTPVTVNSLTPSGDFAESDLNCGAPPFTIYAGSLCYAYVSFTPTSTANPRTGTLTVASTSGNQTVSLSGTGEAATQAIGFTPTTVSFGSIVDGTSSYVYSVYVRNTGTEAVTFNSAATVSGNYSIQSDQCTGSPLAAGTSCLISLTFTPTGTGTLAQAGTLTLEDTAGTGTQTLNLTGTGIPASSVVAINPAAVNFTQQPASSSSGVTYAYLYNYGSSEIVNIASLSVTAGAANFVLPAGYDECTGQAVDPGSYCYVGVEFAPTASGYDTGTITFTDTSSRTYTMALAGYSQVDSNSATLTPAALSLGSQVVGTTTIYYSGPYIYLNNTGNLPLTVGTVSGTNYSASGPSATAEFSLDSSYEGDQCSGTPLSPGAQCLVQVQFTPTASGSQTGTLVFPVTYSGAATAVNLTANLTGTGVAAKNEAILSPSKVVFTDQVVGTTTIYYSGPSIYLTNTGNVSLTVGTVSGANYSASGPSSTAEFSLDSSYYGDQCSGTTLSPGQQCNVQVQFTPTASGSQTGTLVFPVTYLGAATPVNLTATLTGNGVAIRNAASLSPTSVVFADQVVGTTTNPYPPNVGFGGSNFSPVIYLTNTGNLPLTVGTVSGANYSASGPSATTEFSLDSSYYGDQCSGTTVSPGGQCYVQVQFTPTASGSQTGTLVFPVTYLGAATPVNLTTTLAGNGVAIGNAASLSPTSVVFADQVVGTTTSPYPPNVGFGGSNFSPVIYLTNTGNLPLTVGTVSGANYSAIGPSSTAEFSLDSSYYGDQCTGTTVSPGGQCYVQVQFTPTASGTRSGTLVFPVTYSGATKAVNLTATLSGRGISATATLVLSQSTVAFGSVAVGTSSAQTAVTLTNYSASALPITSIVLGGTNAADFTESDSCGETSGTTLSGNSNCTIYVTFSPAATSLGARTATVTETDPATGSPRTITLTGTGTADASAVTFYPASLAFATSETIDEGTPGKVVSINYQGSVPLNVTSVTSSDPTEFPVVMDGCSGGSLATGSSCEITIAFSPTSTGSRTATINIADSATGSPQKLTVTGGGSAQASSTTTLTATPSSGAEGSLFTLVATVKNSASSPIANGSVTFYNGTKALGTAQVVTNTAGGGTIGNATLKTLYLPIGANGITAKYAGANAASTSAAASVTVTGSYTSTAILSSAGVQGSYTLTGMVEGAGLLTPTGSLVFNDSQASTPLGTVALDPTTLTQTFVAAPLVTGLAYPQTVAIADLNGDGKPDQVFGTNNGFTVLLGNGDGTFQAPISFLGGSVSSIAFGDFNGDGKLDIVGVHNGSVGVVLGNGDGTFQKEAYYDSGNVSAVAVGDFNGDGILDIVAANSSTQTIDLLLGNGDGTFQAPVSFPAGANYGYETYSIAIGDVNGDGKLDVVVGISPGDGVNVLLGNGNGTFQAAQSFATQSYPSSVSLADLRSIGKLDIITIDGNSSIGVLLGNGNGSFQAEQTVLAGASFYGIAVGDINGDGKSDLAVTELNNNVVDILIGNGDGTFQSATSYPTGANPQGVAIADLNHDGRPDITVANYSGNTATVLFNEMTQTAKLTGVTLPGITADNVSATYSGDTNFAGAVSNTLSLPSNAGTGSTTLTATPSSGALGTVVKLTATVVNAAAAPVTAGSVNFYDGTNLLSTVELVSTTGIATFETRSLTIGSHALTASFTGDDLNNASSSPAVTVTVTGKYATTTGLTPTGVQGSYALTALVNAYGLGNPSGSVVFTDTSTSTTLGTVALTESSLVSNFLSAGTLTAGTNPRWVVAGDFNGDGKPDLAVANSSSGDISIFIGNGDGTFQAPQTYATGYGGASYIATGDFNGDGKLDLVVANAGTVSILLGNGDGTFLTRQSYTVGSNPYSVAIGDFNGDGKLDLVTANFGSDTLSVLLGNGDGTFQPQVTYAVGTYPYSVAIGDFNGDGKLDLVAANQNSSTVSVLLGNGDGTFQAATVFSAPGEPDTVVTGDVNGDGKLDLVTSNSNGTVGVLLGNGDGTFQAQQTYAAGAYAFGVVLADVNGDGKLDVVTANYESNYISVLLGNGDGTFQAQQTYTTGNSPTSVAVIDLNGDGRPDIVSANYGSNNLSILLGTVSEGVTLTGVTLPGVVSDSVNATYAGDASFSGNVSNTLTLPSNPLNTTTTLSANPVTGALGSAFTLTATVTQSNTQPVTGGVVTFYSGASVLGTGQLTSKTSGNVAAGTATLVTRSLAPGSNSITAKFVGTDSDNTSTSAPQIVTVTGQYPTTTTLSSAGSIGAYTLTATVQSYAPLLPTGNVNFIDTTLSASLGTAALAASSNGFVLNPLNPSGNIDAGNVVVGDFNGDGNLDTASCASGAAAIFLGNGDGTFQAQQTVAVGLSCAYLAVGDLNGDGKLDLVATDGSSQVSVVLGNGDGTFGTPNVYTGISGPGTVKLADFDGDGKLDVVTADSSSNVVSIFLGNGDGTLQAPMNYATGNYPDGIAVGDFNGDGHPDLAVANYSDGTVSILLGNGDGTFGTQQAFAAAAYATDVTTADFNGDGKLDLGVASFGSGGITVLLGDGDGTFETQPFYPIGDDPRSITAADINGDGKVDLVSSGNGAVYVQLGNGDGTFQAVQPYANPSGYTDYDVAVGDFNNDLRPDIIVSSYFAPGGNTGNPQVGNLVYLNQLTESATHANVNVPGTGTHNVTATYAGDANFTGSTSNTVQLAASLATSTVTLTAQPAASVAYGQSLNVLVTVTGQQGVNTPTGNVTYTIDGGAAQTAALTSGSVTLNLNGLAVGSHSLAVNYGGDSIHATAQQTLALTVTKASQTIAFGSVPNTTYGAGPFGISASSTSGLAVTFKVVSGPATVAGGVVTVAGAGTVVLEADQAGNANYNAAPAVQQTFTVAQAALSVVVNNATKVYGSANPVFTSTVTGLVNGDTITAAYSTTATASSGYGTYPITAALSGAALANYSATVTPGTLTITKTVLTVTVNNATRIYGAADPAFSGTITGLTNGDTATATYSTTATASSAVGTNYSITATVSSSNLGNYSVNVVPGTLSITPSSLNVVVSNASRAYGAANPAFSSTINGLLNGDTVTVTYSTTAETTSVVGTYPITASISGAAAANYTTTATPGTLTVTPAVLNIGVNSFTKVYGSVNPAYTGTVTGLLNGDTVVTT
jgi:hypothetical protein